MVALEVKERAETGMRIREGERPFKHGAQIRDNTPFLDLPPISLHLV